MMNLYDGNNVMRRSMEKNTMIAAKPLSLRQRYEATRATDIWVWDGYQHNERRRDIYPLYKMNREPMAMDMFAQVKLWKEILTMSPATQIEVYGWEADDVIATMVRRFAARGVPVTVHSNDMDYAQLAHLPGVTLNGVNTKGIPARWVPLYKAMNGDSSDNIKGIPNFGHKRWEAMEDHWPQIERAIVAGDPAGFVGLPFKPGVLAWLQDEENVKLLQAMLTVTHFENVPDDELEGGIKEGQMNRMAAHQRMTEFFI
jgi:hypothetical protein